MSARDIFYPVDMVFSNAEEKSYAREELSYNVTEDILVILEDMGVSKAELAKRLGKSRSYVTQILSGSRNMTIGSLSDICFVLGVKPQITFPCLEAKHEKLEWANQNQEASQVIDGIVRSSKNIIDKRCKNFWLEAA